MSIDHLCKSIPVTSDERRRQTLSVLSSQVISFTCFFSSLLLLLLLLFLLIASVFPHGTQCRFYYIAELLDDERREG